MRFSALLRSAGADRLLDCGPHVRLQMGAAPRLGWTVFTHLSHGVDAPPDYGRPELVQAGYDGLGWR